MIPVDDLDGGLDLATTIESGQTYGWHRADGRTYGDRTDDPVWFETVVPADLPSVGSPTPAAPVAAGAGSSSPGTPTGDERPHPAPPTGPPVVVRVRETPDGIEWRSTGDAEPLLRHLLRLDDDLPAMRDAAPDDPVVERAFAACPGLRLVREPPFRCLVSFICSTQMRVGRIHAMQERLAAELGDPIETPAGTVHAFPTPERLAATSEERLRDLGLGYRAPYVRETATMVASGEAHPVDAAALPYEEAREELTRFVGVGPKVADCVLLFSLGFLEAVPLDTWMRTAITEHFPSCDRGSYADTSRAIRSRLGGSVAGYTQTCVFDYLRTSERAETSQ